MATISPMYLVLASAVLYGLSVPLAKTLLADIQPVALAGLLYLGAFLGLWLLGKLGAYREEKTRLDRKDLPWLAGVVIFGGIIAPALLMLGLSQVSGSTASLLINLEGVATALIASIAFREYTGKRFWLALAFMTLAGIALAWDFGAGASWATGALFIIAAMAAWGLDNNFTNQITSISPTQITKAKCLIAGAVNMAIGVAAGAQFTDAAPIALAMLAGTVAYGASIVLYIHAQKGWGAARTAAFYSAAPFIGAVLSIIFLKESLNANIAAAFALMAIGAWLIASEHHKHAHAHKGIVHAHEHYHDLDHRHEH